jgi:hypothetical protein
MAAKLSVEVERPRYTADAVRDGDWWAVHVREVPRARTQARRLHRGGAMARDVVSLLLDVPSDSFDLDVQAQVTRARNGPRRRT